MRLHPLESVYGIRRSRATLDGVRRSRSTWSRRGATLVTENARTRERDSCERVEAWPSGETSGGRTCWTVIRVPADLCQRTSIKCVPCVNAMGNAGVVGTEEWRELGTRGAFAILDPLLGCCCYASRFYACDRSVACRACQRNRSGSRSTLYSFLLSITWPFLYVSLPYLVVNYSYACLLLFYGSGSQPSYFRIFCDFIPKYLIPKYLLTIVTATRSCTRDFGFTVLDIKGAR